MARNINPYADQSELLLMAQRLMTDSGAGNIDGLISRGNRTPEEIFSSFNLSPPQTKTQ